MKLCERIPFCLIRCTESVFIIYVSDCLILLTVGCGVGKQFKLELWYKSFR